MALSFTCPSFWSWIDSNLFKSCFRITVQHFMFYVHNVTAFKSLFFSCFFDYFKKKECFKPLSLNFEFRNWPSQMRVFMYHCRLSLLIFSCLLTCSIWLLKFELKLVFELNFNHFAWNSRISSNRRCWGPFSLDQSYPALGTWTFWIFNSFFNLQAWLAFILSALSSHPILFHSPDGLYYKLWKIYLAKTF